MLTVKLFAFPSDADTQTVTVLLNEAKIAYRIVDVEKTGILPYLDRDLDVKTLPCMIIPNGKIEGVEAIRAFVTRSK